MTDDFPTTALERNVLENTETVIWTHTKDRCIHPERCTIHHRTDHIMRNYPQYWRSDRGIMERICTHGIGHPDPDDITVILNPYEGTHGCDGCCGAFPVQLEFDYE